MTVCGKDIRIDGTLIRIARLAAEKYEFLDEPRATIDALRRGGARIDLFTFLDGMSRSSARYPYVQECDNLAALPVSTFDHWWTTQINGKTRNMVRRAGKAGVVVRDVPFDDTLIAGVSAIYNESPTRQGKPFWHYGKDLDAVRQENGTFLDRSVFIGAFLGPTLIGFAKLVIDDRREQAALMQIVSLIQHRDKAASNALIAHAVRSCADRGLPRLVYASFPHRTRQHDTLSEFKRHNGFQRVDLPRYYVPLSLLGRAALHLRLHHKVSDHLPESMLARLRTVRRRWHARPAVAINESL
jgi:hypothetical protein